MAADDVLEAFRRAAGDRAHGAAEIEKRLISDLLASRASWTRESLSAGARLLAAAHAAMAPLAALVRLVDTGDPEALQASLEQRLGALEQVPEALAAKTEPWLEQAEVVVSISRSSSVAAVLEAAWRRGWRGTVVVLDGTSAGGGAEQAGLLAEHGPAVSQPDAAAPRWLDLPESLVVVGADAVGEDRFINCTGSRALVELARARGVPVILIADSGKDVANGAIDELLAEGTVHRESAGREWALFEAVPMDLVTARISD